MRYALQPSSEYQRSAITIEETLCKENHHALRTDLFQMGSLRHLKAKSFYTSIRKTGIIQ